MISRLFFVMLMLVAETGHAQLRGAGGALPDASAKPTRQPPAAALRDGASGSRPANPKSVVRQPVRKPAQPNHSQPNHSQRMQAHAQRAAKGR